MALKSTIQPSEPLGVPKRAPGGVALVALAAVLLVVGAACGGSSNKPAASGSTTTTTAAGAGGRFGAAFTAFSTCMSQHGVKLPNRRPGNGPRPTGGSGAAGAGGSGSGGGSGRGGFGGGGFGGGGFTSPLVADLPPLQQLSRLTGAMSYTARTASQLTKVFTDLPKHVEVQKERHEITADFAIIGALLALAALAAATRWGAYP